MVTSKVLENLEERPNLDVQGAIAGLERPLDMMCEAAAIAPFCFLNAFLPLRIHSVSRALINSILRANRPESFYFGLLITSLSVVAIVTNKDSKEEVVVKAADINLLMNYIYSTPSLKQSETWTPMCVPGVSEEFLLHVYVNYYNNNLGLLFVST